jgi:hypothetical protein
MLPCRPLPLTAIEVRLCLALLSSQGELTEDGAGHAIRVVTSRLTVLRMIGEQQDKGALAMGLEVEEEEIEIMGVGIREKNKLISVGRND